jgi:tetratricopeptide (TPR) repeat protein
MRIYRSGIFLGILTIGCAPLPPEEEPVNQETTTEPVAVLIESTGTYGRPISTDSDLAQQFFDQGLRLTWGYSFPEAVASFQEAIRHDPDHPMLYWGLALSLGPNPNSRAGGLPDDPQGAARSAISQGMQYLDNGNEAERAFVEALNVRFDSGAIPDRDERDQAYLTAARELFERYPSDPDAGSLLGDAYMITRPGRFYWDEDGGPIRGTAEAKAALEAVMAIRPDHPGANHLYIHLLESSNMPDEALPAADRLAALMPGAGHIVHMPSHIYVRVGQHTKSVEHNQRSADADAEFLATWGEREFPKNGTYFLSAENHRRHAYDFIRYSAAIQGNYERAVNAATDAREHEPQERIQRGAANKTIATRWLVKKMFGRWDELLDEERVMDGAPYLDGMWHYAQGSGQVGRGDLEAAEQSLEQIVAIAADPASATIRRNANYVSTLMEIAALALEGEIKESQGDLDGAIANYEAAIEIEDTLAYTEPPDWAQPMRQYLGAALLDADRAENAEAVYRQDLIENRNNGWSLFGLWQSLEMQGKVTAAAAARADFEAAWEHADVELTRSRF